MGAFPSKTKRRVFLILFSIAIGAGFLYAQKSTAIEVNIGRAFLGTGDMRGLIVGTRFVADTKKKLSWDVALSTTIHDGFYPIEYSINGNSYNGDYRYGTTGVQLGGHLNYKIIKRPEHRLSFGLGPVIRYQTSSYYDEFTVLYPGFTSVPVPVFYLVNKSPQRTISIGGTAEFNYRYLFPNKVSLGAHVGLQTDTRGDTITYWGILLGRRF